MVKNKKAQMGDMIFVLVTITSIIMTMVVAGYMYMKIGDGLNDSGMHTNESLQAYNDMGQAWPIFDGSITFILFGLIIGLVITSFLIPSHPIFLIINIIGFGILVFLGAVLSNLYSDFIIQDGLNTSALTYFPISTYLMSKLPIIGAIIVFISTIIMYSKSQNN